MKENTKKLSQTSSTLPTPTTGPNQRDLIITNDLLEWTFGNNQATGSNTTTNNTTGSTKPVTGMENKKVNKKVKSAPGPKIIVDFSGEDESKSLLGCFFGDENQVFQFKSEHFQYRPVISRNHDIKEMKEALFDLNVKDLVSNSASDQIHVWLKRPDSQALDSITIDDPDQACKLFNVGHSLYCRAPPQFEDIVVPKLIKELSYGIDPANNDRYRRGEVEVFYSRKGHYTDFHTDFQENFTIQLSGVKKWIFGTSTATHPTRGCTPHFNTDETHRDVVEQQLKVLKLGDNKFTADQFHHVEKVTEVILKPGDVMYHPAGIWHRVECQEDSISINISLTAVSYADIFCSSLQQLLMENPMWRSAVFHENQHLESAGRPTAQSIMKSMIEKVPELIKTLSPGDLLPFPTMRNKLTTAGDIKSKFLNASVNEEKSRKDEDKDKEESGDEDEWEEAEDSSADGSDENSQQEEEDAGSDGFEDMLESDDEEGKSKSFEIQSKDVNVVAFIESLLLSGTSTATSSTSEDSNNNKKRKASSGVFHDFAALKVKFNPFAVILTENEIKVGCGSATHKKAKAGTTGDDYDDVDMDDDDLDNDQKPISFVIHAGYGNETLESAARATVHFLSSDGLVLEELLKLYHQDRERRILSYVRRPKAPSSHSDSGVSQPNVFSSQDIWSKLTKDKKNRSLDLSEVVRIVVSLHLAGAITLLNP